MLQDVVRNRSRDQYNGATFEIEPVDASRIESVL